MLEDTALEATESNLQAPDVVCTVANPLQKLRHFRIFI